MTAVSVANKIEVHRENLKSMKKILEKPLETGKTSYELMNRILTES